MRERAAGGVSPGTAGGRFRQTGESRRWAFAALPVAILVATAVTGVVGGGAGRSASAQETPAPAALTADPPAAPDLASAMRLAYRTRVKVEVSAERTETSRTFANPDGTLSLEQYADPKRVRRGADWVPVSTQLRFASGAVVPEATAVDLRFSAGGSGPLVTIAQAGTQLSLAWPGALPVPAIDGDTAKYADVLPGVDLLLTAGADSFSQVLVVKTRQAGQNPALASIAFGVTTQGLTLKQDAEGVISALTTANEAVFASDGAAMWDSPSPPAAAQPLAATTPPGGVAHEDEPEPRRFEKVAVQLSGGQLVVQPVTQMLADPATQYPVTIDPAFNGGKEIWTHVSRKAPGTSFWSKRRESIRVGQVWRGTADDDWRAFVQFNTNILNGSTIISASFLITADHTADCNPSPVQLWQARGPLATSRAVTWNNSGDDWLRGAPLQTVNANANESTCPKDDHPIEFGNANVKAVMQQTATGNVDHLTFGLRAPSETDEYQWKRFVPGSAYLDVVYNHTPQAPTALAIDSCYSRCASPAVIRSATPKLSARVVDPDGGTLRVEFEVYDNARTTRVARSGSTVTGVASTTTKQWIVAPRLAEGTYHYRVRACDAYVCGGYSGWFTFTVDTTNPGLPTVTGTPYAESSTGTWNGGPGVAGSFTFNQSATTGTTAYLYSVNNGATTTVAAGQYPELLTPNQRQVSTDTTGFAASATTIRRVTTRGHASTDSLEIAPAAGTTTCFPGSCSFASLGDGAPGLPLGMQPGRRYRVSGWIYVPAATGLNPPDTTAGLRIVVAYGTTRPPSVPVTGSVQSAKASVVDAWQQLSVTVALPTDATWASVRLYNGFDGTQPGKVVYYDDLTMREVGEGATVSIIPTQDGVNVLWVQSLDAAGNRSEPRIYQFLVRPNSDLNWYWSLNEGAGTAAGSAPANNRPASFAGTGGTWLSPGRLGASGVALTGAGELSTASPVLDTVHPAGFSVAAWVRADNLTGWRTAVAQDGGITSMFRLGVRADRDLTGDGVADPAWCFTVKTADQASGAQVSVCTTDFVMTGDWVHLTGVYDRPSNKIKLYVNGTPSIGGSYAEAAYTGAWAATGRFTIGRAWHNTAPGDRWIGEIDEVYAEQEVWTELEIIQKVLQ